MPVVLSFRRAFSLLELVIVVVIIGIIAALAVPRFSSAARNSQVSSVIGSLKVMTDAGELYAAEHNRLSPACAADGSIDSSTANFIARLTGCTTADGTIGMPFGPYLRAMPANPYNHLDTIRLDGTAAGANTDGWRYDSAARKFQADDSAATAALQPDGA